MVVRIPDSCADVLLEDLRYLRKSAQILTERQFVFFLSVYLRSVEVVDMHVSAIH